MVLLAKFCVLLLPLLQVRIWNSGVTHRGYGQWILDRSLLLEAWGRGSLIWSLEWPEVYCSVGFVSPGRVNWWSLPRRPCRWRILQVFSNLVISLSSSSPNSPPIRVGSPTTITSCEQQLTLLQGNLGREKPLKTLAGGGRWGTWVRHTVSCTRSQVSVSGGQDAWLDFYRK